MNKKFSTALFCLFMISLPVLADHITVQGEVSGQWNADTVFVAGNVTIADGNELLISPGTRVIFTGIFRVQVDGALQAAGLPGDSIYFSMADTAGFSIDTIPGGGWEGIRFDHNRLTNDSSIFTYCRFEFGKIASTDPDAGHGGAIYINDFGKVRISHCHFENNFATFNGGAVYLDSANVLISYCRFENNRCGLSVAPWGYGGAVCSDNSGPGIYWNVFAGNSSTGVGGGLAVRFRDCHVYNNIFAGNYSALGGGFGFLHIEEISHRISNNLIVENEAAFFGGGVANLNASPIYVNNTIVFNQAVYGGGFYCKDSVSPDYYNTIIWGNTASVGSQGYLFEVYSQADFFNCDVEGGPALFGGSGGGMAFFGAYESCLDEDPEFIGSGDFPYALGDGSPCYDAGSADTTGFMLPEVDLAWNPRVSHAFIDMGAYEVVWVRVPDLPGENEMITVWPNPTAGKFKVQGESCKVEVTKVEIVGISGSVHLLYEGMSGPAVLEFDISTMPAGVYLLRVTHGSGPCCTAWKKIILQP